MKISLIKNSSIIEYDMKNAGLSVIQKYELLPQHIIDELLSYPKHTQTIKIGSYSKEYGVASDVVKYIGREREAFVKYNKLQEEDILSRKNDAIFVINKFLKDYSIDGVYIRKKSMYTSFMYINKSLEKLELYYNEDNGIVVKGIKDILIPLHNKGMLVFLKNVFRLIEISNDISIVYSYIKDFKYKYINLLLDVDYYREFNRFSMFKFNITENLYLKDGVDIDKGLLDIRYNLNFIRSVCEIIF